MATSMEQLGEAEIIEFFRPDRNNQNVYVTNLPKTLTDSAKYQSLAKIFSPFGLIHEIQVLDVAASSAAAAELDLTTAGKESESKADSSKSVLAKAEDSVFLHYAFVKFYSTRAATAAVQALNRKWMMDGHVLRVQFSNSQNAPVHNSAPLYVSQCRTLANHYLGFNGWCSKIVKLESFSIPDAATLELLSDLATEAEDSATFVPGQDQLCYTSIVQLSFPRHNMACHGAGMAVVKPSDNIKGPAGPITSAGYAKKAALQRATEDAFSRVVLIALPTGKVAIEQVRDDPPGCALTRDDITATLIEVNCLPDRTEEDSDDDGTEQDGDADEDGGGGDQLDDNAAMDEVEAT